MFLNIKMKIAATVLFAILLAGVTAWYYTPKYFPTPFKKPAPAERKTKYEYYEIINETSGEPLMYISVVDVTKGDELLVEDKWYVIVKVVGNRAYARQFEKR